jgi:hypothetical protein
MKGIIDYKGNNVGAMLMITITTITLAKDYFR